MNMINTLIFTFCLSFTCFYSFAQSIEAERELQNQSDVWHCESSIEFFNQYYANDTTLNQLAKTILESSLEAESEDKSSEEIEAKYQSQYSVMQRQTFSMDIAPDEPVMQFFVRLEQEVLENSKNWTIKEKSVLSLPYKQYGYAFISKRNEEGIKGYILILFSKE